MLLAQLSHMNELWEARGMGFPSSRPQEGTRSPPAAHCSQAASKAASSPKESGRAFGQQGQHTGSALAHWNRVPRQRKVTRMGV